ncbi:MAG: AAA family ATPase, partial [Cyclobacteriaceae bacterium]|nr:AAA family ATPase [Cyclobacteriaceae bacterium]
MTKDEALTFIQPKQNTDIHNKYLEINSDMEAPAFFTQTDFDILKKFEGQGYNETIPGMDSAYKHLKEVYLKVEFWAQQVTKRAFPEGRYSIRKRPTNQANKFEAYLWAKLYPDDDLYDFQYLAYTLTISDREDFCIKIDNVALRDNDPLRKKYFEYRGEFFSSPIVKIFKKNEILSSNWQILISKSVEAIKSLSDHYEKLLKIMEYTSEQEEASIQEQKAVYLSDKRHNLNTILYGPPGTGKTFNSIDRAVQIAKPDQYTGEHTENKKLFDLLRKEGQIEFVTFHQNYTYEDFIIGLKPELEASQLKFKRSEGVFYKLCKRAEQNYLASLNSSTGLKSFDEVLEQFLKPLQEKEEEIEIKMTSGKASFWITDINPSNLSFRKQSGGTHHTLSIDTIKELYEGGREFTSGLRYYYVPLLDKLWSIGKQNQEKVALKNFILVIDEINRANISKVFGELITLLEPDKRLGEPNELKINIPNSDKEFGVPPNLYVIGTMNTADKSIALIDIALRRRFEFEGMYPDAKAIKDDDKAALLIQINQAVYEQKKSADYLIGHAYFMNDSSIPDILKKKVIPLLMEYFS